jgi:hypothetical protein
MSMVFASLPAVSAMRIDPYCDANHALKLLLYGSCALPRDSFVLIEEHAIFPQNGAIASQ